MNAPLDLERLDRIAAALLPADRAFVLDLAERVMPAWQRHSARHAERDRLVRLAADAHAALPPTIAAQRLADELRRAAGCPYSTSPRAPLLHQIIRLSRGRKPIEWRRIHDILSGYAEEA